MKDSSVLKHILVDLEAIKRETKRQRKAEQGLHKEIRRQRKEGKRLRKEIRRQRTVAVNGISDTAKSAMSADMPLMKSSTSEHRPNKPLGHTTKNDDTTLFDGSVSTRESTEYASNVDFDYDDGDMQITNEHESKNVTASGIDGENEEPGAEQNDGMTSRSANARLVKGVQKYRDAGWWRVAQYVGGGVTAAQCTSRWYNYYSKQQAEGCSPRGDWTEEETSQLKKLVQENLAKPRWSAAKKRIDWTTIGKKLTRLPAECSAKWTALQAAKPNRIVFSAEEDALITRRVQECGDNRKGLWKKLEQEIEKPLMSIRSRWLNHLNKK